ncbi:MAG: DNA translocase FtsK 4TM domain-containing protein, partial [Bacteroidota bacterium]
MAKNSYKKKTGARSKPTIQFTFFKDRKFHLFIGLMLMLSAIFLLVSFISYLEHGQADQSVVEAFLDTNIKEAGLEVRNAFGLIGAVSSHYFIFLWFGIASLLVPPFLFIVGYRILWEKNLIPIGKAFNFMAFYLIWISLLMGYFLINEEETTYWGFLSGGIGFELAIIVESLMGWGALLIILFLFMVFNMYFFNVTRIPAITK